MTERERALIVVLALASAVFACAKAVILKFTAEEDFRRRRNVWFLLTVAAFLSPTFWWYAAVAAPLCFWAVRKDHNALAFYLMILHVAPVGVYVLTPLFGVASLVNMSSYRLLSLVVLLPVALRLRRAAPSGAGFGVVDAMILGYALLQVIVFVPADVRGGAQFQDTPTNMMRRAVEAFLDVCLVYYVASRQSRDRRSLLDALAALCLSGIIMAVIAMFEAERHWLLYFGVADEWAQSGGGGSSYGYVMRSGDLRATAATGHTLQLGYVLAVCLGVFFILKDEIPSRWARLMVPLVLLAGILASFSRGPMLGTAVVWFTMVVFRPDGVKRRFQSLAGFALLALLAVLSPVGDKVLSLFPMFGGQVDSDNITYRQRLAERCWEIIQAHPWFGDQQAYLHLDDMRQGQGIVDFVNAYAETAVFYGLVGAVLLFGGMFLGLHRLIGVTRRIGREDPDMARLGAGLIAVVVGTLVMLYTASLMGAYVVLYFVLLGIVFSYLRMNRPRPRSVPTLSSGSPG